MKWLDKRAHRRDTAVFQATYWTNVLANHTLVIQNADEDTIQCLGCSHGRANVAHDVDASSISPTSQQKLDNVESVIGSLENRLVPNMFGSTCFTKQQRSRGAKSVLELSSPRNLNTTFQRRYISKTRKRRGARRVTRENKLSSIASGT